MGFYRSCARSTGRVAFVAIGVLNVLVNGRALAVRLRELEAKNAKAKKPWAEAELDRAALKEPAESKMVGRSCATRVGGACDRGRLHSRMPAPEVGTSTTGKRV